MKLAVLAVVAGCASEPHAAATLPARAVARDAVIPTASAEVVFAARGRSIPGTIVTPAVPGRWPAIVLLAGSGPTDRDWGSGMLATDNGSGKLLAAELASRGAVVLRFDKAHSGRNAGPPLAELTLDTYRDEALAAIAFVRARPDVRADRVFVAGHSEGGVHATRVAAVASPPLAGVIYLSTPARTLADTMLAQIEANLAQPLAGLAGFDARVEMPMLRAAFADFLAGRAVDPVRASTIPQLQQLVASVVDPRTAPLMRSLLRFDNAREAPALVIPAFILNGAKDVQVDPDLDARLLAIACNTAGRDVTLHISPDADHVLKHEPRPLAELRADLSAVNNNYNAEDRPLDADVVSALVAWLADHTR